MGIARAVVFSAPPESSWTAVGGGQQRRTGAAADQQGAAVLEALLKASPASLSAERLLEQAWDENVDPFTNPVKVTVVRITSGYPNLRLTGAGYRIS
jgi:DNA-binding response OmpR family regulator